MPFFTRDDFLKPVRMSLTEADAVLKYQRKASVETRQRLFLSHSHRDQDIVENVRRTLAQRGVDLFIDWKHEGMPKVTGIKTAHVLKKQIVACGKLVLLATNNALASRWVPWELGIADAKNGLTNVLILPVEDTGHPWKGSEYIGIYPCLRKTIKGNPYVTFADKSDPVWLKDWLEQ